ncbi:MAG: hypothetical protein ACXWJV_05570, partial [Hyphomicrobium sp.]
MIIGLAAGLTPAEAGEPTYNWSGVYIGAHTGGAIDYSKFSNPYGPTLFGDEVRSPGPIGGLQFGGNYQMGQVVLGLQANVSGADMGGTFTCLQPGPQRARREPPIYGRRVWRDVPGRA